MQFQVNAAGMVNATRFCLALILSGCSSPARLGIDESTQPLNPDIVPLLFHVDSGLRAPSPLGARLDSLNQRPLPGRPEAIVVLKRPSGSETRIRVPLGSTSESFTKCLPTLKVPHCQNQTIPATFPGVSLHNHRELVLIERGSHQLSLELDSPNVRAPELVWFEVK